MSFNSKDSVTATLERPTNEQDVAKIVDTKLKENSILVGQTSEIEREFARFDNSHTASGLDKVYNEIDRETINSAREANEITSESESDNLERIIRSKSYQDVVRTFETPTIQIDEVEASKETKKSKHLGKKSTSRMKLWITTGACCLVLLVGLVVCNALSIGNIERQTRVTENMLIQQEQALDGVEGQISAESGKIPENMREIVNNGGEIDISPIVSPDIVTSDNFFNRLAKFISYLFGR